MSQLTDPEARIAALERKLASLQAELVTDELTKIYNRRGLLEALSVMVREVSYQLQHPDKRRNVVIRSFSIIFLDLDNFKAVNSRYGHQGGDAALQMVAAIAKARLRGIDVIGRYGGEEFVIGLVGADANNAQQVAEDIRSAIAQSPVNYGKDEFFVTISCGVVELVTDIGLEEFLRRADAALYQAKRGGRNKVVVYRHR